MLYSLYHIFGYLAYGLQVILQHLQVPGPDGNIREGSDAGIIAKVVGHRISDAFRHYLGVSGASNVTQSMGYFMQQGFRLLVLRDIRADPDQPFPRTPVAHEVRVSFRLGNGADGYILLGCKDRGILEKGAGFLTGDNRYLDRCQLLTFCLANIKYMNHPEEYGAQLRLGFFLFVFLFLFLFGLGREAWRQDHYSMLTLFNTPTEVLPGLVAGNIACLGFLHGNKYDIPQGIVVKLRHRIDEILKFVAFMDRRYSTLELGQDDIHLPLDLLRFSGEKRRFRRRFGKERLEILVPNRRTLAGIFKHSGHLHKSRLGLRRFDGALPEPFLCYFSSGHERCLGRRGRFDNTLGIGRKYPAQFPGSPLVFLQDGQDLFLEGCQLTGKYLLLSQVLCNRQCRIPLDGGIDIDRLCQIITDRQGGITLPSPG